MQRPQQQIIAFDDSLFFGNEHSSEVFVLMHAICFQPVESY